MLSSKIRSTYYYTNIPYRLSHLQNTYCPCQPQGSIAILIVMHIEWCNKRWAKFNAGRKFSWRKVSYRYVRTLKQVARKFRLSLFTKLAICITSIDGFLTTIDSKPKMCYLFYKLCWIVFCLGLVDSCWKRLFLNI